MLFLGVVSWKDASCFNGRGGSFSDRGEASFLSGGSTHEGHQFWWRGFKKIVRWGWPRPPPPPGPPPPHYGKGCIEKQGKVFVKSLLDVTYLKLRKLLVTDYTKISTILELYPTLRSEQQVNEKPFCLYLHSTNSFIS